MSGIAQAIRNEQWSEGLGLLCRGSTEGNRSRDSQKRFEFVLYPVPRSVGKFHLEQDASHSYSPRAIHLPGKSDPDFAAHAIVACKRGAVHRASMRAAQLDN